MQLKLVTQPPTPTILFTLDFANPPEAIPVPPFWVAQLHVVAQDELERPPSWLSFDRSAWAATLLKEVIFNIVTRSVTCMFHDHSVKEWYLTDMNLIRSLESILSVVNESSVASEMEIARETALIAPPSRPATPSSKVSRHKKSRSLFQSIVAAFCPSHSTSPPLPFYDLPQQNALVPPEPPRSSAVLRRQARAELVDIYRRYVIPQLESPFINGGYVYWNLQSLLQRVQFRMQNLVQELGGELPHIRSGASSRTRISSSNVSESPFEDDASSTESEESVHTPRDSMIDCPVLCRASPSEDALIKAEKGIVSSTKPVPVSRPHSTQDSHSASHPHAPNRDRDGPMAEYALLHAQTVRLRSLIHHMEANERNIDADRAANLAILEVRSKRRAWSSIALHGRAEMSLAGLSRPMRSSPLAYCKVVTPQTLEAPASVKSNGRYTMGIPRMPGGRVGATRMSVARERGISTAPSPSAAELHVPSQRGGYIPFPQTDPGDDFCSTGPQDTTTLFGGPDAEMDDFVESSSSSTPSSCPSSPSFSSDNLPELLKSISLSEAICDSASNDNAADEFGTLVPSTVPSHILGPAKDEKGQEFTLALDVPTTKARRHSRSMNSKPSFAPMPWISDPIPDAI